MAEKSLIEALAGQGPAWTLVAIFIIAMWRFVTWAKPWLEKLFSAHLEFMKGIDHKFITISERQEEHGRALADIYEVLKGR